jgi:hypothetical protein
VIHGAGDELAGIRALQTEVSVRGIYVGMPEYHESLRILQGKGFDMSGMFPVTSDQSLRVIECDCVLINSALVAG